LSGAQHVRAARRGASETQVTAVASALDVAALGAARRQGAAQQKRGRGGGDGLRVTDTL